MSSKEDFLKRIEIKKRLPRFYPRKCSFCACAHNKPYNRNMYLIERREEPKEIIQIWKCISCGDKKEKRFIYVKNGFPIELEIYENPFENWDYSTGNPPKEYLNENIIYLKRKEEE